MLALPVVLTLSGLFVVPTAARASIGPGPGLERVPAFYALLGWVGLALAAALLWPVGRLRRSLWRE